MARAAAGMRMGATGTAAGGAALRTPSTKTVSATPNDQGAFTSMTLSGLTSGENTILISTSGQTYTVVVDTRALTPSCRKRACAIHAAKATRPR